MVIEALQLAYARRRGEVGNPPGVSQIAPDDPLLKLDAAVEDGCMS